VNGGLARRYARALLGLVSERSALDATGEELSSVASTFAEPRLRAVVLNPGIDIGARRRIVGEIVSQLGVSADVGNLVRLLADRDRLPILGDVARAFEAMVDTALGRARVRIRTAQPLGASEKAEIVDLARRLVGLDVVATTDVDADLLGGVVLDAGGTVYDGSIRTQLARVANDMAGGEG
jgi:F-type H+-transporting ATPase subunit delta